MANFSLTSTFIGLFSALRSALVTVHDRPVALPRPHVDALRSPNAQPQRGSGIERPGSPTWPPPEGVYWGM